MDKLKKVLSYRFWILLVVALIVPVVGWSMAKSGMVTETEARTKKLTDLTKGLSATADDPNSDWQKGVADVNNVQKSQVRDAWTALYEQQLKLMTWPARMPDDPAKLEARHLEYYLTIYAKEIEQVRQIIKPIDETGESGLVEFSEGLMPHPEDEWLSENRAPSAKEVEAAQEDIWLLSGLLKALADVNSNATSQYSAPIRQVDVLYLRGGSDNFSASGAGARREAGDDAPIIPTAPGAGMSRPGQGFTGNVSFNPDEEFGLEAPDPEAAAAAAAAGAPVQKREAGDEVNPLATASRQGGKMLRYVKDTPEWKTRGFYMELVMDHRQVPALLVSLANAEWPIRVMRVHQADLKDEELISADDARNGRGMAGAGDEEPGGLRIRTTATMPRRQAPRQDVDDDRRPTMGGNLGGRPNAGRGAPRGGAAAGASAALDDHMLVNVAIDGVMTIFKKPPPEEQAAPAGSQETPGSQADSAAPETAADEPPATDAAETFADEAAAAPEAAETAEPATDEASPSTEKEPTDNDSPNKEAPPEDKPPADESKPES